MSRSDAVPSSMGKSFPPGHLNYAEIFYEVMNELGRAHAKFPDQSLPWGGGPDRIVIGLGGPMAYSRDVCRQMVDAALRHGTADWLMVITEEFLEAGAESKWASARAELIQMIAMGCRAIADGDARAAADRDEAIRAEDTVLSRRVQPISAEFREPAPQLPHSATECPGDGICAVVHHG